MRLDSEHYYQAALERIRQARALYERGDSYALSMYVAGVAVECLLRAFNLRKDVVVDERHDLLHLLNNCGIMDVIHQSSIEKRLSDRPQQDAMRMKYTVSQVAVLWANDFRYAANDRLRSHMASLKLGFRIKGDLLKGICLKSLDAAEQAVEIGAKRWKHFDKK